MALKYAQTLLIRLILKAVFKIFSLKKIDERLVVFADERQSVLQPNMFYLHRELEAQKRFRIVRILPKGGRQGAAARFAAMARFTKYYAYAKYIVLEDYYYPLYVNRRRKETRVIQLWHACGPFKRFGYQCADGDFGLPSAFLRRFPIHTNYTHIPVCSEDCIPYFSEGFNIGEEDRQVFYAIGAPRTDVFFNRDFADKSRQKLGRLFAGIGGRKVVLYAPTFRGGINDARYEGGFDMRLFKQALGDRYVFITKMHPFVKSPVLADESLKGFCMDVTGRMDISEALCVADICITDYSSLIFEYSLFNRPMIFYVYDFEPYMAHRGTYYDYETFVPGPMARTADELLAAIRTADEWFDPKTVEAFKQKYMRACDGQSAKRAARLFFGAAGG